MRSVVVLGLVALLAASGCDSPREASASFGGTGTRVLIQNKGSDTLVNVAQTWAEEYRAIGEDVAVAVSGGGTGTEAAALSSS